MANTVSQTQHLSLPLPLKIVGVILGVGIIGAFFSLREDSYILLGFILFGVKAKVLYVFFNIIAPVILLAALWKRHRWMGKLGFGYFIFLTINTIAATANFAVMGAQGLFKFLWPSLVAGAILAILLGLCSYVFWRYRIIFK